MQSKGMDEKLRDSKIQNEVSITSSGIKIVRTNVELVRQGLRQLRKCPVIVTYNGQTFVAIQWNGSDFPTDFEEFEGLGFFEDDNGYDLESVDTDFVLEVGRRYGVVRLNDWVLKNNEGKFSHVSEMFFRNNFKSI